MQQPREAGLTPDRLRFELRALPAEVTVAVIHDDKTYIDRAASFTRHSNDHRLCRPGSLAQMVVLSA